jgi:hypothetical protein
MNRKFSLMLSVATAMLIAGCNAGGNSSVPAATGVSQSTQVPYHVIPQWLREHQAKAVCPQVVGKPSCLALLVQKNGITPLCSPSGGCGFTPSELEAAYGLTSKLGSGSGQIVAVIEAGDLADASSDLATYRSEYGLGTANLVKYNENGQESNYPPSCEEYGWCVETDLDIDMVSAACPKCTIYLMEAKGPISDFETAEAEAVKLGATILSNSWICYGSSDCGDSNFDQYFDTPGIAYLGGSGDEGYAEIGAPAALDTVIAVGGTQLEQSGSKYTESLWTDAGGGCSGVPKPSWQHDPDCSNRTVADVAAEAGCAPGVAVYIGLYGGWNGVCGTSASTPFTGGVIGLAGNATSQDGGKNFWTATSKQHKKDFHHPSGTGSCGNYLCGDGRYKKYYSGPGGWGSPNGISAY